MYDPDCPLSPRELQVLAALPEHGTVPAAAPVVGLKPHTVETYLTRIREKLDLHHLPQIIAHAYERGWLPLE